MIRHETAQEIVRQEDNLALILRLRKYAESGVPISVVAGADEDDDCCIEPTKELLLPFLEECKKYVISQIDTLNKKAKEELSDVN